MSALEMFPEVVPAEDPNRRYTTREFMAWIKAKAGVDAWDLDAAADAESHHAPRWFSLQPYPGTAGVNGLAQWWLPTPAWHANTERRHAAIRAAWSPTDNIEPFESARTWRIFVNPPFDDLGSWVAKAWETTMAVSEEEALYLRIGFVLPGNRHEQPFWHEHVEPFRDGRDERFGYRLELHFPEGRQAYAKPGSNGVAVGSADFPSALLVWRRS